MELACLRRAMTPTSALVLVLVYIVLLACPLGAQEAKRRTTPADRPGGAPYTPTRVEWAAIELQSYFGRNWTSEDRVDISYMAENDGATVRCVLQYTPDVSAQNLKMDRDLARVNFDKYAARRGWSWLRLEFEEHVIPAPR